jgi:hypothetical protein
MFNLKNEKLFYLPKTDWKVSMFKKVCNSLMFSAMLTMLIPIQGHAGDITKTELDTVPNADFQEIPLTQMGDLWTFRVRKAGNVTIKIDTRDDNGDLTSNLDPIAFLFDQSGKNLLESADDTFECSREPVCGYSCPEIGPIFLERGMYKVVVRDFNGATVTDAQCNGGAYSISVTGRVKRLRLVKDDKNVILDAATEAIATRALMEQATSDDKIRSLKQQEVLLEER